MWFVNFSPACRFLFILLIVSFVMQRLFSLSLPHLLIFDFVDWAFAVISKYYSQGQCQGACPYVLSQESYDFSLNSVSRFFFFLLTQDWNQETVDENVCDLSNSKCCRLRRKHRFLKVVGGGSQQSSIEWPSHCSAIFKSKSRLSLWNRDVRGRLVGLRKMSVSPQLPSHFLGDSHKPLPHETFMLPLW